MATLGSCQRKDCYLKEVGFWIDKNKKQFKRGIIVPSALSKNYVTYTHGNIGIFETVLSYNEEEIDKSYMYGDMYLDFDCEEDFEKVRQDALYAINYIKIVFGIKPEQLNIYYSGNKGVHILIDKNLLGVEPHLKLNYIFKSIAVKIKSLIKNDTLDMQIYDNKRMFRIPNSIHETSKLYKIPLALEEFKLLSESEIKALASRPRVIKVNKIANPNCFTKYNYFVENYENILNIKPSRKINTDIKMKYTPPCMEYILENGAGDGNRNNITAIVASYYKCKGVEYDIALEEILEWNTKSSPPLQDREVRATVHSIYSTDKAFGCSTIKNYYTDCGNCKYTNNTKERGK